MLIQQELRAYTLVLVLLSCVGAAPIADGTMCAIEKAVVHHMRPAGVSNPPAIVHAAVEDGYAVAVWTEGEAGGTAVLRKRANEWVVLSESGGWNSARGLMDAGVPKKTAEALAKDFGMSAGSCQSEACAKPTDDASQQYKACDKMAKTQFAMDVCASEELKRADTELDRVYGDVLSSSKSDPIASAKVVAAQKTWQAYRDAYIDALYPAKDKLANYGSIYPLEVDMLRASLARQQIEALSCLLHGPEGLITGSSKCP